MLIRAAFDVLRIVLLAVSAAVGYVSVYVPLMELFFDKRVPFVFLLILLLSITASWMLARIADKRLPRLPEPAGHNMVTVSDSGESPDSS